MDKGRPLGGTSIPRAGLASKKSSASTASSKSGGAGAVDEAAFEEAFTAVPKIQIFSVRDVEQAMSKICSQLAVNADEWERRVDALRQVRALVLAGAADQEDFIGLLRGQETHFQSVIADLRSQVVREACITVAFLCQELRNRVATFVENLLVHLFGTVQNSAKIISSSGLVALRFVFRHVHSARLLPHLYQALNSKSTIIRRSLTEVIELALAAWPTHCLEKHLTALRDVVRKGMSDADQETRALTRRVFICFERHFPEQADALLQSLDPSKRKLLDKERDNVDGSGVIAPSAPSVRAVRVQPLRRAITQEDPTTAEAAPSSAVINYGVPRSISDHQALRQPSSCSATLLVPASAAVSATTAAAAAAARRPYTTTAAHQQIQQQRLQNSLQSLTQPVTAAAAVAAAPTDTRKARIPGRRSGGVSQSQPTSREHSPNSRSAYYTSGRGPLSGNGVSSSRLTAARSRIPRSQGTSRDTSPSRLGSVVSGVNIGSSNSLRRTSNGRPSRVSIGVTSGPRTLSSDPESEQFLSNALTGNLSFKRRDIYDSDDAASETSSLCSDSSYRSFSGSTSGHRGRRISKGKIVASSENVNQNMVDILVYLNSNNWADRKDGLLSIQSYLKSGQTLNATELRKVTEVFTKMFHDAHNKVMSLFLETIHDLVVVHNAELIDWLYVLLVKLLTKLGNENLTSQQARIQRALDGVKDSFSPSVQFYYMCRFVGDPTQTPNLKVRVALLHYTLSLVVLMQPDNLNNCKEVRLAVTKFTTWAMEPKSVDVRKCASLLIISLFDLNSSVFSAILQNVPSSFQEAAYKILRNQIEHARVAGTTSLQERLTSASRLGSKALSSGMEDAAINCARELAGNDQRNISPEDIHTYIRQTTEEIQSLYDPGLYETCNAFSTARPAAGPAVAAPTPATTHGQQQHQLFSQQKQNSAAVMSSGQQQHRSTSSALRDPFASHTSTDSGILNSYSEMSRAAEFPDGKSHSLMQNASAYSHDQKHGTNHPPETFHYHDNVTHEDLMCEILQELSNHNDRYEERKICLQRIVKMLREKSLHGLDENFKPILLILLETLGDSKAEIRALALRVLQEFLQAQANRFWDFAELTIIRILECHRDDEKMVVRAAEECAAVLARVMPAQQCVRVLAPVLMSSEFGTNLAAIKMLTRVVQENSGAVVEPLLAELAPGMMQACENNESNVRKAAIFGLVALHAKLGDAVWPYLSRLSNSKIRLLNLYISRAKENNEGFTASGMTSPTNVS